MTQNGFLGTIGYIKGNLMSNSNLSDKGYNNETFYPGSENVPISDTSKPSFKFKQVGNISINDKYDATSFSQYNYVTLSDMPLMNSNLEMRICFTMPSVKLPAKNTFIPLFSCVSTTNNCYEIFLTSNSNSYYLNLTCGKWTSTVVMDNTTISSAYFGKNFDTSKKYNLDITRNVNGNSISHNSVLSEANTGKVVASSNYTSPSSSLSYVKGPIDINNAILGKDYNKNRGSASFSNGIIHLKECYFRSI